MIYTWECRGCCKRIDVSRKLTDYLKPPFPHEHPCASGYKRIITPPRMVRVQEYEDTETGRWPV